MNIMITNDDGINAPGIWALFEAFESQPDYNPIIIAPNSEKSAVGHGITLYTPLRVEKIQLRGHPSASANGGYAVDGTPVDCVRLGIQSILDSKPQLVISGINRGANLGNNINYSGTVAAAKEASLFGIPSIAVSIESPQPLYYKDVAQCILNVVKKSIHTALPFGSVLNFNFPNVAKENIKGIRLTKQYLEPITEKFEKRVDPWGNEYYWTNKKDRRKIIPVEFDAGAVQAGYISLTPLQSDATHHQLKTQMPGWDKGLTFI